MDTKEQILDVAISALQQQMWVETGQPPRSMFDLAEWAKELWSSKERMLAIFNERVPGVTASMADVEGEFWEELWRRLQDRKIRGN